MPMHDWTRVSSGTFDAFHNAWITHIQESLNAGVLPAPFYALGEQRLGDLIPDVLTLHEFDPSELPTGPASSDDVGGILALTDVQPRVRFSQEALEDVAFQLKRQRSVVIRHSNGDRVVAIIEIVSPANRHSIQTLDDFADKVISSLRDGIHVTVIDPFPTGPRDPDGIHGYIWQRLMENNYTQPHDLPMTMVSYTAGHPIKAWVEPIQVGDTLTPMPLFITPEHYIELPLEETYEQSWAGVPARWKRVIENG